MGRDLHAYLEYYDKEAKIWEGLAKFYFHRHSELFDILIQNANGLPDFEVNPLSLSNVSLEVWSAWQDDRKRLGIHHEGHLNYDEIAALLASFLLADEPRPVPTELQALCACVRAVYDPIFRQVRLVYWFDN